MALPGVIAGTIGRFTESDYSLESYAGEYSSRVLDVEGSQSELTGDVPTTTGRAATVLTETRRTVRVDGTHIELGREEVEVDFGTEWAVRGRIAMSERSFEDGSGFFPFTLFSAVCNVKCEKLRFDTEAVRKAWKEDGTLSETWLAGSKDYNEQSTTMTYGKASEEQEADIGLGFERAWDGFMLRGVVYSSGYVAVFEESIGTNGYLRFVEETLLPHGYVPEDPKEKFKQAALGDDPDGDEEADGE